MRGTIAKRLRRYAERMTVGKPDRRIVGKKVRATRILNLDFAICAINDPQTTRGAYRKLKRMWMRGEVGR